MELHLDHTQTVLLRELLDSDWRDLRYEIADTDNSSFKRNLKQREQTLRSILDQLVIQPAPEFF
jgi:hypothetical protein